MNPNTAGISGDGRKPPLEGSIPEGERILVFERDFHSYHLNFVRAGIQQYFEKESRTLSFVNMGVVGLLEWYGTGILSRTAVIGMLKSYEAVEYFKLRGIPLINLVDLPKSSSLNFDVSFEGEGTVAAAFFRQEMNLDSLGYIGRDPSIQHDRRGREFEREAIRLGARAASLRLTQGIQRRFYEFDDREIAERRLGLQAFLHQLPKPAGVFCADDRLALQVYYTAAHLGIQVPDELSILGVGSRGSSAEPWTRAISVVQLDHQELGYAAAKLMDSYFATGKTPVPVRLKPCGIHHSETTLRRNTSDSLIRRAMLLIQQRPEMTVTDLYEELEVSRDILDTRFQRSLNLTAARAIDLERFQQAKRLLSGSDYGLEAIAGLAGYPSRKGMRRSFYRFTRMSPRQFREISRRTPESGTGGQVEDSTAESWQKKTGNP